MGRNGTKQRRKLTTELITKQIPRHVHVRIWNSRSSQRREQSIKKRSKKSVHKRAVAQFVGSKHLVSLRELWAGE